MRVIGLMSGTSMDGVDCALIDTDGEYHIERLETASVSYDKDFKSLLKTSELFIQQSTKFHAIAIEKLLKKLSAASASPKIDLIGYHGQTILHHPEQKISVQIGSPARLANQFNIPVIYDFRTQDILNGGEGAPLAPLYHQALMIQKNLKNIVMINCGGIANISIISGGSHEDIQGGFDTGPGNVLLDPFVQKWTDGQYLMDENGKFAASGNIDFDFLKVLYEKTPQNNYYQQLPPKSLDYGDIIFIKEIAERFPKHHPQSLHDGCATLAAFTAYMIAENIPETTETCVISGGGAKNPAIIQALKAFLPDVPVHTADEMGWSATYMEAELMAWLAVRSLKKLPLSIPQTTGVRTPTTGGQCVYPQPVMGG